MSHYKPYLEYMDSSVEWLGQVPAHWKFEKLKYIAKFSGGGTPSREKASYWIGNSPWVSPKDMKSEALHRTEESITVEGLRDSTTNLVAPGHILLVVRSGILKHTIPVAINEVEVSLNQDMKVVRLDSYLCSSQFFLRWVQGFNNDLLQAWLKQGATVESIEQEFLAGTIVPLPPILEQRAIVLHLDREIGRIDGLVSKKKRFIELLCEKRQAMIVHAVTKGLDPNVSMKDSGAESLGQVPFYWDVSRVKYAIRSIGQGWSPECESRPAEDGEWGVLKVGCVNGGVFRSLENKALPETLTPRQELALKKGDVLVSRANTRELVGGCAVIEQDFPRLMICDKLYRLIVDPNRAMPAFLAALIAVHGRREVELEATGASASMVNIAQSVICNIPIALPPLEEQVAIILAITAGTQRYDTLISTSERSIELLKERRSALITAAVTGQIDLRETV
jgi:type I restriction enzyme S subunit